MGQRSLAPVVVLLVACLVAACHRHKPQERRGIEGSGVVKNEDRKVGAFSELHVAGLIHATFTLAETPHLALRGDDNLLAHVLVTQQGPRLSLTQDQLLKPALVLSADIAGPPLSLIIVDAAAQLSTSGIHADKLTIRAAGVGRIEAKGSVDELTVVGSLAAKIDLSGLAMRRAVVTLDKGAQAKLGYVEELVATVGGVARLEYTGEPRIEQHLSEHGAVVKAR